MRFALLGLLALSACAANSPLAVQQQVLDGSTRVVLDPTDEQMLTVQTVNTFDFGYDLDNVGDREKLIAAMLTAQCGSPSIESTRATLTGSAISGRQIRTYTIRVRCPNGASRPV